MALSNTATPKYYGEFRDKVLNGEIYVCNEVSMQMNRIDDRIADPHYYYDPAPVDAWIRYNEAEMTLTDGSDLHMLLSFKLWAEDVYGWYYFTEKSVYEPRQDGHGGHYVKKRVKHRLCQKQYLIVARGGAKSLYCSCHHSYVLNIIVHTTQQIVTAPTMKQADETLAPIRTAIARAKGPYFKFMTQGSMQNTTGNKLNRPQLASTKEGIQNFMTNSIIFIRPMKTDSLQGFRPFLATVDEWLSGDTRDDPTAALEQGASKNADWLMILTSSEGTVRNGIGDTIKMELMQILKGEYYAPHVSIWWYKLDDISEVNDPEMWVKAQPNIGVTVQYEAYQMDVERAEKSPSARNDILAKRFGIPMEGFSYFFRYEETLKNEKKREYWQMECAMGADMSQGDDFCAFTFLFPLPNGIIGIKCRSYITERTLMRLPIAMRKKYEEFINEGSLIVMPGVVLDIDQVYDELDQYIVDSDYTVLAMGYDPYNADKFVDRWAKSNGPYGIEKVIQGAKTETVPLGEIKIMAEDRLLNFDQSLMEFCMGNCITLEDTNGNRKLSKMRRDMKIDNVSALMDGYIALKAHKELFR